MLIDLLRAIPAWLRYVRYVSLGRWLLLGTTVLLFDGLMWLGWETTLDDIALLLLGNLAIPLLGIGGLCAPIGGIRRRYGEDARISPYAGPWIFRRPRRWYFSAWLVRTGPDTATAVLTLGSDLKDEVAVAVPPTPAAGSTPMLPSALAAYAAICGAVYMFCSWLPHQLAQLRAAGAILPALTAGVAGLGGLLQDDWFMVIPVLFAIVAAGIAIGRTRRLAGLAVVWGVLLLCLGATLACWLGVRLAQAGVAERIG